MAAAAAARSRAARLSVDLSSTAAIAGLRGRALRRPARRTPARPRTRQQRRDRPDRRPAGHRDDHQARRRRRRGRGAALPGSGDRAGGRDRRRGRVRGRVSCRRCSPWPRRGGQGRGDDWGGAVTISLRIADEVAGALAAGVPVVALETTLVSHGFSAGRGLAAAIESEDRVRAAGAVPATVGDRRRRAPRRARSRGAGAVRRGGHAGPQGRRAGHRGLRRPGRARIDHGRRNPGRVPAGRDHVHGHGRHRRRAPGLRRVARHLR